MPPTKIFNRTNPESHRALNIFQQLWEKADDRLRASLENFALDHRVDEALEKEFVSFVTPLDSGLAHEEMCGLLKAWVGSYKATYERDVAPRPAFLSTANANNRVDHLRAANAPDHHPRLPW